MKPLYSFAVWHLSPLLVVFAGLASAADAPRENTTLPWIEGATTLAVLPDTQYYAEKYPQYFEAQTRWIAENHSSRNIALVIHLGDITEHDIPREWKVARRCFSMLDGKVPYLLLPGNHDYSGGGRKTRLSEFFPVAEMRKQPTFGGVYEEGKLDNSYHLFQIGKQDWLALGLECGPRDKVIDWANGVLAKHPERRAIVVTHAYLFRNNQRYDHRRGRERASPHGFLGEGADGEELWQRLIRKHPNVMIVLSGHVATGGLGYLASEGDYGNIVHQMMVCYQKMRGGGQAFLRTLEFLPDGKTVQVRTFSPALKRTRTSKLEDFTFELQGPTRTKPAPVSESPAAKLSRAPTHRYSFDGAGGDQARITDSTGGAHGTLHAEDSPSALDGKGRLALCGGGWVELPSNLLKGLEDASFEVWFTPTADRYKWLAPVWFGNARDWLAYTFRTLNVHRATIAVNKYNNDIQRKLPVKPGIKLQVAVTYDHDGADGKPLLSYYFNGLLVGTRATDLRLADVKDTNNRIGPFPGTFNELRLYDYALPAAEVRGSFDAGPDEVRAGK